MKAYQERVFGVYEGQDVLAYTFENEAGYQLTIMTYGATVLRYVTPDKAGQFANVVLGFDDFASWVIVPSMELVSVLLQGGLQVQPLS